MPPKKLIGAGLAIIFIIAGIWYLESLKPPLEVSNGEADITVAPTETVAQKQAKYPLAKEIVAPAGFINTDSSLRVQNLIGKKVILVDFWTYSCINCQRTFPYLTSWYEKYRDEGLEIIGVHTPEFEFEKEYANVKKATERYGIKYPVVQDNDYATWRAYANRYWPRKYLIDIDGFIVYDHIGEGAYEQTERKIQELLNERMARLGEEGSITSDITAAAADELQAKSPEIYFGASRNKYLGSGRAGEIGAQSFAQPERVRANALYLAGDWDIQNEYALNLQPGAKIIFRYQASDVFFVAQSDNLVKVKVMVDGKIIPASLGGEDVKNGFIEVKDSRLYKVIETSEYQEHTLELIIEEPGLEIYTFTFG